MYKAGDVVINRRGDVVRLQNHKKNVLYRLKYEINGQKASVKTDGNFLPRGQSEYDIVGYAKMTPKNDDIKTPQHYHRLSPEPLVVLEQWNLGNCYSNAVKYICRAGHKEDAIKDLRKAIEYLERKIEMLENNKNV